MKDKKKCQKLWYRIQTATKTNSRSVSCAAVVTIASLPAVLFYLLFIKQPHFSQTADQTRSQDPVTEEALAFWAQRGVRPDPTQYIVRDRSGQVLDDIQAYRSNLLLSKSHAEAEVMFQPITLDVSTDVLVHIHIQKTGGSHFANYLVHSKSHPCQCVPMPGFSARPMCRCVNKRGNDWLMTRHSVGWPCGVHAGFNELTSCVDQWYNNQHNEDRTRNYIYLTMLRDPITRFMSEWLNTRQGATWKDCRLHCDGRDASLEEVPFCFKGNDWSNVTFDDFINCPSNMAFNRQTRMLANLSLSDCYRLQSNKTQAQRDEIMLESAKSNLARFIKYFGLAEYQSESQLLFERTFPGWRTAEKLRTVKWSQGSHFAAVSETVWDVATQLNTLDVRLYQYAKDLFLERLRRASIGLAPRVNASRRVLGTFKYGVITAEIEDDDVESM